MKKHLEVVAAVIQKEDKFFVCRRSNHGELALKWEFPGGKIEPGEMDTAAVEREFKEELDAALVVQRYLDTVDYEYETFTISLHFFMCTLIENEVIKLLEHVDAKWLTLKEIRTIDLAAADMKFIKEYWGRI